MREIKSTQVIKNLLTIGVFLQKTGDRLISEFGLSQQQFVVLNEIVEKNTVYQKQLVCDLLLEKSHVSKTVKKLKNMALIRVITSNVDARKTHLSSTEKGKALWRDIMQRLNCWNKTCLLPLTDDQLQQTLITINRLRGMIGHQPSKENNMTKKIIYFYSMKNDPQKIQTVVPSHVAYWKTMALKNYIGGPFADRSGGLISFETDSLENATKIIEKDPFVINDIIAQKWIKEWLLETRD